MIVTIVHCGYAAALACITGCDMCCRQVLGSGTVIVSESLDVLTAAAKTAVRHTQKYMNSSLRMFACHILAALTVLMHLRCICAQRIERIRQVSQRWLHMLDYPCHA